MNDIINAANANNIRLFADDTSIFIHNKNIYNLIRHTKSYFMILQKWCLCNKVTLNSTKSYFSIFHTKNKHVPEDLNEIVVDNMKIKRSNSVKYIGKHIDEYLNWNVHVDNLLVSLLKYFGIFNQLKDYVSNKLARQLYYAFVCSNINYGIEVYGSCKVKDLYKVSLLSFVHANLQGDCPDAVKNYFVKRNISYSTRQAGHIEYRRARLEFGKSRVQYQAAEL